MAAAEQQPASLLQGVPKAQLGGQPPKPAAQPPAAAQQQAKQPRQEAWQPRVPPGDAMRWQVFAASRPERPACAEAEPQ